MIDLAARVAPHPAAAFRDLGEGRGGVLLQLESGGYHGLNAMGVAVWGAVGDGTTFGELVAGVRSRLRDPPEQLVGDLSAFVSDLAARDLLVVTPAD